MQGRLEALISFTVHPGDQRGTAFNLEQRRGRPPSDPRTPGHVTVAVMDSQLLEAVLEGRLPLATALAWALGDGSGPPPIELRQDSPWRGAAGAPRPQPRPADFRASAAAAAAARKLPPGQHLSWSLS